MKSILFNQAVLERLSPPTQQFFRKLEIQSIIVSLISGGLFGLMLQMVGKSFWVGFILVSIVLFFVFEALVLTPEKSPRKSTKWLRLGFGILIALLNAYGLKLFMFEKSYTNYFIEQQAVEVAALDSVFAVKAAPIQAQISGLETENDAIHNRMNQWSERIYREVDDGNNKRGDGFGKYAQNFSDLKRADSAYLAPVLRKNISHITSLEQQLKSLTEERKARHAKLIDPSQRDILERIRALEHILGLPGNGLMIVFFVAMFLGGIYLELSTLIVKMSHPEAFAAYVQVQEQLNAETERLNALKSHRTFEQEKRTLELRIAEDNLAQQQAHEKREAMMQIEQDSWFKQKAAEKMKLADQFKELLNDAQLKRYNRQAPKSHLMNGSSKQESEPAEE